MVRSTVAVALVVVASSAVPPPAAEAQALRDRVADGNAELPVSPWSFSGFGKVTYGAPMLTTPEVASGTSLFASLPGNAGATMTQRVELSDRAAAIDAGTAPATVLAKLGGIGAAGAQLIAQPVDGAGLPVGGPLTAGPPTAADRLNETLVVPCRIYINALPPATRALVLTVTSPTGGGLADDISVYDAITPQTTEFRTMPYQGRRLAFVSGGTNNCDRASIGDAVPADAVAKPRITVRTPARVRAGRTVTLRASVRNASKTGNAGTTLLRIQAPKGLRISGSTTWSLGVLEAGATKTAAIRIATTRRSRTSNRVRLTLSGSNVRTTKTSVRVRVAR